MKFIGQVWRSRPRLCAASCHQAAQASCRVSARLLVSVVALAFSLAAAAQDLATIKKPKVEAAPVALVTVRAGSRSRVELPFRVLPGFHINSNKPNSELLIPTSINFDVPTNISIGKVQYPVGKDESFAFAPKEKLSVYTGDFSVHALVVAARSTPPGRYRVHGRLKYQACDNRACYPPSQVPVSFDVSVKKAATSRTRRNPGQSPHIKR